MDRAYFVHQTCLSRVGSGDLPDSSPPASPVGRIGKNRRKYRLRPGCRIPKPGVGT